MPDRSPVTQEQVAACVEDQYQGEAVRNILRGVATLSQYARFSGEEIPSVRKLCLPRIPALIAREAVELAPSPQPMHWTELVWQRLLAYPPGTKVPSPILADMDRVVDAAITVPKHGNVMPAQAKLREFCAFAVLCLGDQTGDGLRARVWDRAGMHWVVAPDLLQAARTNGLPVRQAERLMGVDLGTFDTIAPLRPGQSEAPAGDPASRVSYASMARAVTGGKEDFDGQEWSKLLT